MALTSGLYGLFRLDGGPVDARDAAALSLPIAGTSDVSARAVDDRAPGALHRVEDADGLTIVAGHVEEASDLAARLGLASGVPVARLARVALGRFGTDTPVMMIGEWSLLHWDPRARRLTLTMAAARRDRIHFAVSDARVAVSPDLFAMARIGWIGDAIDPAGLLFGVARADLRARIGDRTMLTGVRQIGPGMTATITRGHVALASATIFTPQPRWTGSFADAVVASEDLLRQIMRERLARTATPVALLSGGLDSSTLAWVAATERGAGQPLGLLTSVAPPGSGLADEAEHADVVAARLGLATRHVWPSESANIYRPPDAILGGASRPPLVVRHCLTATFQAQAQAMDATMLIDGNFGELTLTGKARLATLRHRLRRAAGRLRRRTLRTVDSEASPSPFHVRLAPTLLADLPEALRIDPAARPADTRRPGDLWGYLPGADKAMLQANELHAGAVRMELPFRDLRLLRLFAGFPADFLNHGGLDRAPARHMLTGHLPDSIRLRTRGRPASLDHLTRLRRQAPAARARIPIFRRAGVGDWLDLDWLDATLAAVAARGTRSFAESYEVQLTAIVAEFLIWWHERR